MRQLEVDLEGGEPIGVGTQRGGQSEILEHGWPQPANHAPDVSDRRLRLLACALHELVSLRAAGVASGLERERDPRER